MANERREFLAGVPDAVVEGSPEIAIGPGAQIQRNRLASFRVPVHHVVGLVFEQLEADLALEQVRPVVDGLVLVVVVLELEAHAAVDALVHARLPGRFVRFRFADRRVVVTPDVQPKRGLEVEHLRADDALQVGLVRGVFRRQLGHHERPAGRVQKRSGGRVGILQRKQPDVHRECAVGHHRGRRHRRRCCRRVGCCAGTSFAVHLAQHLVVRVLVKVEAQLGAATAAQGFDLAAGWGDLWEQF